MVNSMTGYGRSQQTLGGRDISVEIRSVNHRYFELSAKIPRVFLFLEEKIKSSIQSKVSRGKIEVNVTMVNLEQADAQIELNMDVARGYAEAMERMSKDLGIANGSNSGTIARMPEVFNVRRAVPDEEETWHDVHVVLDAALESFCSMRAVEGERLKHDIESRLKYIAEKITEIESQSENRLGRYREKLFTRMQTVLENTAIDENRILLEAALYADKAAIDEETVRLRSHLDQFSEIFKSDIPVGRKLDFLVQEINREVNTIGSKTGDFDITSIVVDLKSEIEKIREQIQNIE